MRKAGALTSLRYRARRLRSRLGLAGLWAADRLEALADTVAVGLLRAAEPAVTRYGNWARTVVQTEPLTEAERFQLLGLIRAGYAETGTVGILRPVVPPRRSPTGVARRNDLLAIRAIAERRPRASTWAVDVVLLEMRGHGASVTIAEAEQIARRIATAATYQPAREVADARD